jgi:hypothetical protein
MIASRRCNLQVARHEPPTLSFRLDVYRYGASRTTGLILMPEINMLIFHMLTGRIILIRPVAEIRDGAHGFSSINRWRSRSALM